MRSRGAAARLVVVMIVLALLALGGVALIGVGLAHVLAPPHPDEGAGSLGILGLCGGAALLVGFAVVWRWLDLREALVQERRYRDAVTLPQDFGERVRFVARALLRRLSR